MVLDGKSLQEYPVNAGVSQGSILGPTLFVLYFNDLPDDLICNIAIYADDHTLRCLINEGVGVGQGGEVKINGSWRSLLNIINEGQSV